MRRGLLVALCLAAAGVSSAAEVIGWRGAALGVWTKAPRHCRDVRLEDGVIKGRVTGRDPQLHFRFAKPLVTKGNHVFYVKLRTPVGGRAQLFWIREGDADASEDRQHDFFLRPDGKDWQEHRVILDWPDPKPIVGLRLDLPLEMAGDVPFEIAELRLCEEGACVDVDTADYAGVSFSLKMPKGVHYCSISWSGLDCGRGVYYFSPATDGERHDYWFDLRKARDRTPGKNRGKPTWRGRIVGFRVEQSRLARTLPVENLRFVKDCPDLKPDLTVTSARPASAIPRAGRPLELEVVVRNYGTRPAKNVRFSVKARKGEQAKEFVPEGNEVPGSLGHETFLSEFRYRCPPPAHERVYRLKLDDPGVGRHRFELLARADGCAARSLAVDVDVLPSLGLPRADYPAEPAPVSTAPYEIGACLFPGWQSHVWHTVWERAPWRKPVLGWYDESKPETVDWQIKHLVENGISFVLVDWYWTRWDDRSRPRKDWPTVFARAKYRKYLKWSVMWANHTGPGTHTPEDQETVTKFWAENYFCDPQYQTIDGLPVVTIWDTDNMERDMRDKGGCKALLEISQRVARSAGYKGIYFVAMRGSDVESPEFLKKFSERGFRRTCVYRYLGSGVAGAPTGPAGSRPFPWVADTSLDHWRKIAKNATLPFMPSLSTAWDNRPWVGEEGWEMTGINAPDFARICRDARRYADESGERMFLMGPLDEWGEGEIGGPNAEHGFGFLEAVREAFGRRPAQGWPVNHAPEDVGLKCPQKEWK